jgi:hypothetical protein
MVLVDGWDAIPEAGRPLDCKPHGLRKAAGRLLVEADATATMIMSILDHTTLAEAARHTEDADQASLAGDAVIELEGHKARKSSQPGNTTGSPSFTRGYCPSP